ncbi:MAG: hypothetical protein A2265_06620, partial [Bacteroidetes bacterium RIFOXYA12_FULL_33_9]
HSIPEGVEVLKLAFVFRNADGSIQGKASDGSDIFVTANAYTLSNYSSHTFTNNQLRVNSSNGTITIKPFASNMVKISIYPDGNIVEDTSYSVVLEPTASLASLTETSEFLNLDCGELSVKVQKNPIRLSYYHNENTVFSEEVGYFSTSDTKGLRFQLTDNENIYGTGSRATPINKNGQQFYSYNEPHYSYSNGASTLNINIPFFVSSKLYGVYFENRTASYFDFGKTNENIFEYTIENGNISYHVVTGDSYDDLLDSYTDLTGKQPIPPRWALGYMQSRFGYQNETETRNTINSLINDDFPVDAVILDLYWFGQLSDMGNLSWDYSNWATPTDMISDFNDLGVKTILISEPYVTQNSFNYSHCDQNLLFGTDFTGGYTYIVPDFFAGSAGLLDIFKPATKEWFWTKYKARTDEGVAGWWCDVGEPENHPSGMKHVTGTAREVHNVYALEWASMLHKKYQEEYPSQRLFNLMRSGYAGMQRYSTFPWSGDINRSFEGYQAQIPIMLGMGMSGVGYMHSDLGGFTGGAYNPELYTRWMQFGAFCPIMRPHGEGVAPEPIYYPETEKNIVRTYVKLRYQLMPYNYTLAWENSESGRPLAMPINYFESENASLSNVNDEYLWGENILIAPIMNAGETSRNVLFPSGKWYDFQTNQSYEGNSSTSVSAPLEKLPIFVKAGSFIPMVAEYNNTENYSTDTMMVKYYPDISVPTSTFKMYDDDGHTPLANITSDYDLLIFSGEVLEHQTNIRLSKNGNGYVGSPANRYITFEVQLQSSVPYVVEINGTQSVIYGTENEFSLAENGAYYDAVDDVLYIKYNWTGSNDIIVIGHDSQYNNVDENEYFTHYLQHPFPNPFSEFTNVSYNILEKGLYNLSFYNVDGSLIYTEKQTISNGNYTYNWNTKDLAAGVYYISLDGKSGKQWMKVIKTN